MELRRYKAVVIGASAGGFEALRRLFSRLPESFPLPVVVVQHLQASQQVSWEDWVGDSCRLAVEEAEDKGAIAPGRIHFAPPGYHLLIERDETFTLSVDEKVRFSRPSIDVLFESAAAVWRSEVVGVILTGANNDGADGLRSIREAGGLAIVQDPSTAEQSEMPEAALRATRMVHVLGPEDIGEFLARLGSSKP